MCKIRFQGASGHVELMLPWVIEALAFCQKQCYSLVAGTIACSSLVYLALDLQGLWYAELLLFMFSMPSTLHITYMRFNNTPILHVGTKDLCKGARLRNCMVSFILSYLI